MRALFRLGLASMAMAMLLVTVADAQQGSQVKPADKKAPSEGDKDDGQKNNNDDGQKNNNDDGQKNNVDDGQKNNNDDGQKGDSNDGDKGNKDGDKGTNASSTKPAVPTTDAKRAEILKQIELLRKQIDELQKQLK